MMKTFRKLIGLVLCACLLLPCLPVVALGEAGISGNGTSQVVFTIKVRDMNDIDRIRPRSVKAVLKQYAEDGSEKEEEKVVDLPKSESWETVEDASVKRTETVEVKWENLPATDENGYLYLYGFDVGNDDNNKSTSRSWAWYNLESGMGSTRVSMPWGENETKRDMTVNFYRDGRGVSSVSLTAGNGYEGKVYNYPLSSGTYSVDIPGETSSDVLKALEDRLVFTHTYEYVYTYTPRYGNVSVGVTLPTNYSSEGMAFDLYKISASI